MYPLFDEIEENLAAQPINVPESWGHQLFYVEQPPSPENPFRLELNIVNGLNSSTSALPLRAIMEDETLDSGFETETAPVRAETSNAINNPEHDHDADEDQEQEREIATEEAKEDPGVIARFTGGAFRQTSEQVDIKMNEMVDLMVARAVFTGLVFIGVVHSHPQYKRYSISAENVPDTDGQKAPFYVGAPNVRDSKFVSVRPPESSGFGVIHGSVVKMRASSIVNLIFFVLSTNRQNYGKKKLGKLWDLVVLPFTKINAAGDNDEVVDVPESLWNRRAMCSCQVMSELREEKRLKKRKRNGMATSTESGGDENEPPHVKRQRFLAQCQATYEHYLQHLSLDQLEAEAQRNY